MTTLIRTPRHARASLVGLSLLVTSLTLPTLEAAARQTQARSFDPLPVGFSKGPDMPETFEPRWNFASAYYPPADQVVLFGGAPAEPREEWRNDTWLYAAGAWSEGPAAPTGLTPRGGAAMAYFPGTGRLVMFGGEARSADGTEVWPPYSNETWLWDGARWARGPAAPPQLAPRTGAQMVYDAALDKIVLFGGSGLLRYTDTWLFDGAQWTRGPDAPPEMRPRVFFGMAYDEAAETVVVGGGDGTSDVWLFDGIAWTQGPSFPEYMVNNRRERTRMAYNPQLEAVMLFGGLGPESPQRPVYYLRTSAPDPQWLQVPQDRSEAPGGQFLPPPPRIDGAVAWVPTLDAMMFFGGFRTGFRGRLGFTDTGFFRDEAPHIDSLHIGPIRPGIREPLLAQATGLNGGYFMVRVEIEWSLNGIKIPGARGRILRPIWLPGDVIQARVRPTDALGVVGSWTRSNEFVTWGPDSGSWARENEVAIPESDRPARDRPGVAGGTPEVSVTWAPRTSTHSGGPAPVPAAKAGPAGSTPESECPTPTPGQVVACQNQFWKDRSPILLHGVNTSGIWQEEDMTREDYERITQLHMNVVRMHTGWGQFEPQPPTPDGEGGWVHHWEMGQVPYLREQIEWAHELDIEVLIESRCFCGLGWPKWLGRSQYNSHGKDYNLLTEKGRDEFNTDYWSDELMQQFTKDWVRNLTRWVGRTDGIMGYEPLVEPSHGNLPANHDTTQMILDFQLELAKEVRAVDPNRVIFFTTRGAGGVGVHNADFSEWAALGNTAFDAHDFFGARWGSGFSELGEPEDPTYGETGAILYNFTLKPSMPPYLGTTDGHVRYIETFVDELAPTGIPVFVGEFGGNAGGDPPDPDILAVYGTMTQAMNILGVSWTALSYDGYHSLYDPETGAIRPWGTILCEAAAYPEIVTDCPEAP